MCSAVHLQVVCRVRVACNQGERLLGTCDYQGEQGKGVKGVCKGVIVTRDPGPKLSKEGIKGPWKRWKRVCDLTKQHDWK